MPDQTAGEPYTLTCLSCTPHLPKPFPTADARGRWAAQHQAGTGHDSWRVIDPAEEGNDAEGAARAIAKHAHGATIRLGSGREPFTVTHLGGDWLLLRSEQIEIRCSVAVTFGMGGPVGSTEGMGGPDVTSRTLAMLSGRADGDLAGMANDA
jgi:hypothetical protein